jgi:lysophospholipase L1-like esterase
MASNIENKINRIASNVAESYSAAAEKGATIPTEQNSDNLPDVIRTIPTPDAHTPSRGNVYYGYEFSDCEKETGLVWYYTPSEREGDTIGDITYDCPEAGTGAYGYAIANTAGLALVRNKPIDRIRFRLSPSETATSGVMKFAVIPVNGTTYTHYIEAEFTAENIENSWVTIELDEPFSIGDNETFVIQPVDSTHSASNIGIAVLRASATTTTDEYINIYNAVPKSWGNAGNYITRLGLCVDLGYSKAAKYSPNYDASRLKGGWNSNNITPEGYVADIGYANSVIIEKYYVCDDIVTDSLIELTGSDAVVAFSSTVRTDGAGGRSVGSLVKYDFASKKMYICKKTNGTTETDAYVTVDISSVVDEAHKKYVISAGRVNSRVFASVSNYITGSTVTKTVEDISVSDFSPVGRFYDYLTFSQLSGSTVYWRNLYTYVPSNVNIAFLGDSITQGIYIPAVSDSWVSQVKKYYGNCVSSGRGGAKADFIIDALDDGLVAAFNPQYVVVTIGTNGDTTPEKLGSIVKKIKKIGAVPIINCVSQTQDGKTTGDEQYISEVNDMIRDLHTLGARFDIATGENNDPNAASPAAIMQDEVHPNVTGHLLMAERFKFDLKNIERVKSATVEDVLAELPIAEGVKFG